MKLCFILAFLKYVHSTNVVIVDTWCQLWGTSACVYDHNIEMNKQFKLFEKAEYDYRSHSTTSYAGHLITTIVYEK